MKPLEIQRTYRPSIDTINEDDRSIEAILTTQERTEVYDWTRRRVVEEVLLMGGLREIPEQVPLLDSHQQASTANVIGSTRDIRIESNQLIGRLYLSSTAEAEWTKIREKHITDNSVGYRVLEYVDIPAGKSKELNGVEYRAREDMPLMVTTEWVLRENSLVARGADSNAVMRGEDISETQARDYPLDKTEEKSMSKENEKETVNVDGLEREEVNTDQIRTDAMKAERERVASIMADGEGVDAELVQRCITDGDSVADARGKFLAAMRNNREASVGTPAIHAPNHEYTREVATAVMTRKLGGSVKNEKLAEQAEHYRDDSLLDICREACRLDGKVPPRNRDELIRASFNSATMTNIVTVAGNHSLQEWSKEFTPKALQFCGVGSLRDYKASKVGRLQSATFTEVGTDGVVDANAITDSGESATLQEWGVSIGITRKNILNDDIGLVQDMLRGSVTGAVQLIDHIAFKTLIINSALGDSVACYHASHSNLQAASTPLSSAALATGRKLMTAQTEGGQPMGIEPRFLIVPDTLFSTAYELCNSQELRDTTSSTKYGVANPWFQRLIPIADSRLENSSYTNYNDGDWYLVSDPKYYEGIRLSFLNGITYPTITPKQADSQQSGMFWQVLFDVTCSIVDHRCLVKSDAD